MLLYGSENWTWTKAIQNKLEAFKMWIYRRMMRISWTEHKSNEEVQEMKISKRSLAATIKKRKVQYLSFKFSGLLITSSNKVEKGPS